MIHISDRERNAYRGAFVDGAIRNGGNRWRIIDGSDVNHKLPDRGIVGCLPVIDCDSDDRSAGLMGRRFQVEQTSSVGTGVNDCRIGNQGGVARGCRNDQILGATTINPVSPLGRAIAVDAMVEMAIALINNRTDILPNIKIQTKKLNIIGPEVINDAAWIAKSKGFAVDSLYTLLSSQNESEPSTYLIHLSN